MAIEWWTNPKPLGTKLDSGTIPNGLEGFLAASIIQGAFPVAPWQTLVSFWSRLGKGTTCSACVRWHCFAAAWATRSRRPALPSFTWKQKLLIDFTEFPNQVALEFKSEADLGGSVREQRQQRRTTQLRHLLHQPVTTPALQSATRHRHLHEWVTEWVREWVVSGTQLGVLTAPW
jgi:hypothetical protein